MVGAGAKSALFLGLALLFGLAAMRSPLASEYSTLKGHGGPIMGLAVHEETGRLATASFDNSVGFWADKNAVWLEGHEAAVNVVAFLGPDRLVSGGDDFSVRVWDAEGRSGQVLGAHRGKIRGLAISPDQQLVASASWDGTVGLWPLGGQKARALVGHNAGVSTVAFSKSGRVLFSAGADGTIREWDVDSGSERRVVLRNGFPINVIVLGGWDASGEAGWVAYGAVDGAIKVVDITTGTLVADITQNRRPVLAMVNDPTGSRIGVGDGEGYIAVFDTQSWTAEYNFHAVAIGPVWALAFSPDGDKIYSGGLKDVVEVWPIARASSLSPAATLTPSYLKKPEEMSNGERQFARKCSICHTLKPDTARKAGPSLFDLFGRQAGTYPGYTYSANLTGSDLVWNAETINKLFDLGPDHYIPGSKMPMQRIVKGEDRADLIRFLKRATASQ